MMKRNELSSPQSCLNRAKDGEILFVLLARDVAAPSAIREWVASRLRLGKNNLPDPQIQEALACARAMELQRKSGELTGTDNSDSPDSEKVGKDQN